MEYRSLDTRRRANGESERYEPLLSRNRLRCLNEPNLNKYSRR